MNEFIAQNKDFIFFAMRMNFTVVIAYLVTVFYEVSLKRLEKKGYSSELAHITRKFWTKGGYKLFIVFMSLQIFWTVLLSMYVNQSLYDIYLRYTVFLSLAPAYSVYSLTKKKFHKQAKEIMLRTNTEVIVDFNYETLKYVLNWKLELASTIIFVYYACFYFNFHTIFFLMAFVFWLVYFITKKGKYYTKASFNDIYTRNTLALIALHIYRLIFFGAQYKEMVISDNYFWYEVILFALSLGVIMTHLIVSIRNYPRLKERLNDIYDDKTNNSIVTIEKA